MVLLGLEVVEPGPEMVLPGPEVVDSNISGSAEHVTESCRSIHSPFLLLYPHPDISSLALISAK